MRHLKPSYQKSRGLCIWSWIALLSIHISPYSSLGGEHKVSFKRQKIQNQLAEATSYAVPATVSALTLWSGVTHYLPEHLQFPAQLTLSSVAIQNLNQLKKVGVRCFSNFWSSDNYLESQLCKFEEWFESRQDHWTPRSKERIAQKILLLRTALIDQQLVQAEKLERNLRDIFSLPTGIQRLEINPLLIRLAQTLKDQDPEIAQVFFNFGLTVARLSHRKDAEIHPKKQILLFNGAHGTLKTTLSKQVLRAIFEIEPASIELSNIKGEGLFGQTSPDGCGTKGALAEAMLSQSFRGRNFPFLMDEAHLALNPQGSASGGIRRPPSSLFALNGQLRELLESSTETVYERGLDIDLPVGAMVGILITNEVLTDPALLNRFPMIQSRKVSLEKRTQILRSVLQEEIEQEEEFLSTAPSSIPLVHTDLASEGRHSISMPLLDEKEEDISLLNPDQWATPCIEEIIASDTHDGVRASIYVAREYQSHLLNRLILKRFLQENQNHPDLKDSELVFLYRQLELLHQPFDVKKVLERFQN